jgi:glutaredoxin-related protein
MSQPYLFYSDQCPNSKQIIETLKALNKSSLYKFVLINKATPRDKIPAFLKAVPTLYVPETKDVIIGKDIYGFIAKPTNARNEKPIKETNSAGAAISGPPQQSSAGDYSAWGFEGQGLSESYSLWDAPSEFASSGGSMYTFLDSAPTNTGGAGMPTDGPETKNTIAKSKTGSNGDVAARMEAMANQRKSEFGSIERK